MTKKRFTDIWHSETGEIGLTDDGVELTFQGSSCFEIFMNELNDNIEHLEQSYSDLKHRHSLLHDELLDVEVERDSLKKDVFVINNYYDSIVGFEDDINGICRL